MKAALLVLLLVAVAVVAAALPIDDRREPAAEPRAEAPRETPPPRAEPTVPRARCADDVPDCAAIRGRVMYVERVDPDGDGDLHVVVLDGSVTAPGITAVDVRPELRPRVDPRVGDRVSAAGPVQRGSHGQSQIHALEFHAQRG
jgi:hypothetical protein